MTRLARFSLMCAAAVLGNGLVAGACGSSSEQQPAPLDAAMASADVVIDRVPLDAAMASADVVIDRVPLEAAVHPDASCAVTITTPPLLPGTHVAIGTPVDYSSNPPSSGPHYPIWAAYEAYSSPVDRRYYVHDLEHGAVVFVYKCAGDAECADIATAIQAASDALPDDPECTTLDAGVRVRTVITPDPLITVPVAAVAWGWLYTAECIDLPSLKQFARDHYGQGTEDTCANGTDVF